MTSANLTFDSFSLPIHIMNSLGRLNITEPTPIQQSAIPKILANQDILASAQTGTGKTFAYLIPLIMQLMELPDACALILAPTRELAAQVRNGVLELTKEMRQFRSVLLIGGEPMFKQFRELKRNPQIVIGTPGRIHDHLSRRSLELNNTKFLVLDETDRMLDMGFSDALNEIVSYLPAERQTLMFSATLPPSIVKLSQKYLNQPERITIGSPTTPSKQIKQSMIKTSFPEKFSFLMKELTSREGSVIIFVKTKMGADELADKLNDSDQYAQAIHGDLNQRRRNQVIKDFRAQKNRILVATDVAARGLDIDHVSHVINYDLPQSPEDYIHRIGRTGRAGNEGEAVSLVTPKESYLWQNIQRLINSGVSSTDDENERKQSQRRSGGGNRDRFKGGGGGDRNRDGRKRFGEERSFRPRRDSSSEPRSYDDRPSRFKRDSDTRTHSSSDERPNRFRRDNDTRSHSSSDERPNRFRRDNDTRSHSSSDERPNRFKRDNDTRSHSSSDDRPSRFKRDDSRNGSSTERSFAKKRGFEGKSSSFESRAPKRSSGDRFKSDKPSSAPVKRTYHNPKTSSRRDDHDVA